MKKETKTTGWTLERRVKQAERCRNNRPFDYSTGPKTGKGKQASAQNSYKHGFWDADMNRLKQLMRAQKELLKKMCLRHEISTRR